MFGSHAITWQVSNIQLLYFIHRCRIVRRRYMRLYIILMQNGKRMMSIYFGVKGSKVKVKTVWCKMVRGRCRLYILVSRGHMSRSKLTLSTLWFWHDNFNSFQLKLQISYVNICRMVRGRYPNVLGSKRKCQNWLCQHFGSDTFTWLVFSIQLS